VKVAEIMESVTDFFKEHVAPPHRIISYESIQNGGWKITLEAFEEQEYYQLMFGVEVNCCVMSKNFPESELPDEIFGAVIQELVDRSNNPNTDVCKKYYTFWSIIHGLISINIVNKGKSDKLNQEILKDAITGIIRTIVA